MDIILMPKIRRKDRIIFRLKTPYGAFFIALGLFSNLLIKKTSKMIIKPIGISRLTLCAFVKDSFEKTGPEKTKQKVMIFKATLSKYKKPNWSLNFLVFNKTKNEIHSSSEKEP